MHSTDPLPLLEGRLYSLGESRGVKVTRYEREKSFRNGTFIRYLKSTYKYDGGWIMAVVTK